MSGKLKSMVLGGLVAGSLVVSAVAAIARDTDSYERHAWEHREGSRSEYSELEQARQKALYDASHHASRKKIAQDDAVVDEILAGMGHRH